MSLSPLRVRAFGGHLLLSCVTAALVAALVFFVWYPAPLWQTSGGSDLLIIILVCDLILGPLITLLIANPRKSRRELTLDISLVVLVQLGALTYGMWTVLQARPTHVVFERDQYRVIRATDIPENMVRDISPGFEPNFWSGPRWISLRTFQGLGEQMAATTVELEGVPLAAQPKFWTLERPTAPVLLRTGKSLSDFLTRFPDQAAEVTSVLQREKLTLADLLYFPFVDKKHYMTVLVNKDTGEPVAYLPVDPYGGID